MTPADQRRHGNRHPAADPAADPADPASLRDVLRGLRCVQAGWAFGVPEDGRDQWLDLVCDAITAWQAAPPGTPAAPCYRAPIGTMIHGPGCTCGDPP